MLLRKFCFFCLFMITLISVASATTYRIDDEFHQATGTRIAGATPFMGEGELSIDNTEGGRDAVAIMTVSGSQIPFYAVYIRDGDSHTIQHIPDNTYNLYFSHGSSWNQSINQFNDPQNAMFADQTGENPEPFLFETTTKREGNYINTYYSTFFVTLFGIEGGAANTKYISEKEKFPSLL
jgi:hypothetical protein